MKLSLDSAALLLLCGGNGADTVNEFGLLMAVMFEQEKKEEEKKIHSQVKKLFYHQLAGEERVKQIKYVGCPSLVPVYCSPWHKLFYSGDESALITMTVESKQGWKKDVESEDCLGLVLLWTRTRGSL
eukprot:7601211-Ditylum_brightwellii.AAC.1